ncbi:MAG: sigma-54 dependent transcriptional regulator [Deltaproteobacteria bacterium]|nr:sigma-54 dependent transcriptional regulator [Deltaproteobacteria bacterium]
MKNKKILIVDDDLTMRMALADSLETSGYDVCIAENGDEALKMFGKNHFEVVVTDMRMPKMGGMDVLKEIKKISPQTPVILITAYGTVKTAVEAMKEGAAEFIMKPFSLDDLEFAVRNVLASRVELDTPNDDLADASYPASMEIITRNDRIIKLLAMLKNVAKSRSSILIQGESGTGKELFARFIYLHSKRRQNPFVAVNCAAIPNNLLESEMFGYEKGAFTGALFRKPGKFELADGGTLLLDEVSEMDVQLQAKLLRVVQEGEIDRLGGKAPVPVDVRIIATTNIDLKAAVEDKKFRGDLFYRLNVIPLVIPALRERRDDIPLLADHFLKKYSQANDTKKPDLSPQAIDSLMGHDWPGNVRELENTMERAILICENNVIHPGDLFLEGDLFKEPPDFLSGHQESVKLHMDTANMTLKDVEKALIYETLSKVDGNKSKASRLLGISVRTMRNKLHEYQLEGHGFSEDEEES